MCGCFCLLLLLSLGGLLLCIFGILISDGEVIDDGLMGR